MSSPGAADASPARAARTGLVLTLLLVVLAFALPALFDWQTWSRASRSAHPWASPPLCTLHSVASWATAGHKFKTKAVYSQ